MIVIDIALIVAGFLVAGGLYLGNWPEEQALRQAYLLLPIFLTIAFYQGTYCLRALIDARFAAMRVIISLVISAAILAFVAFYLKTSATFSRGTLTLGLLFAAIMMIGARFVVVWSVERRWHGFVRNRLLLLDDGPELNLSANKIIVAADFGLDPAATEPHDLDRLGQLLLNQDEVIVSCPPERREQWAWALKASGVHGEIISDMAHNLGALGVRHYESDDCTSLVVSSGPLPLRARVVKRIFDIIVASTALVVLSPLLVTVALLIWLGDRGPVLFVQQRTGQQNRFFSMLKFRSMKVESSDAVGVRSTAREDERVTRLGRFMRQTSIDELPQLVNVLRGEMSIVGPRPHATGSRAGDKMFWHVDARYWRRHALKPGLTGLAQVRGYRGATDEERDLSNRLQADLEYLANWSLVADIGILFRTLMVLRHDRAY
ncbi:exopolysaccharide biosynthesis polyprenyl glycosylphosphotransferase [Qipengyuania sp. CAU 1752]